MAGNILGLLTSALAGGAAASAGNKFGGLLSTPFEKIMRGGAGLLGIEDQLTPPALPSGAAPAIAAPAAAGVPDAGYDWSSLSQALGSMATTLADASQKNYGTLAGLGAGGGSFATGFAAAKKGNLINNYTQAQIEEAKAKAAASGAPGANYGESVDAGAIRTRAAQILAATPNPTKDQVGAALTQAFNEVAGGKVDTYTDAGGVVHTQRRDLLPGALNAPVAGPAAVAPAAAPGLPVTTPDVNAPGGLPALPEGVLPPPSGAAPDSVTAPKAQVAGQEQTAKNFADRVKDLQTQNSNIQSTLTNLAQAEQLSPEAMQQGTVLSIDQQKALSRRFQTKDNQRSLAAQAALESNIMQSIGPMLTQLAGPGGVRADEVEQLRDRMGNAPTDAERQAIIAPYVDRMKNKRAYNDWQTTLLSHNIEPTTEMKNRWFEQSGVQPDSFLPLGKKATDYLPAAPASQTVAPSGPSPTTPVATPAPAPAPAVAVAKSKADYDKLPAGTRYRGPDGVVRVKR